MNPQSAWGGALQNVERFGQGVLNNTVVPAGNLGANIIQNLARDFRPPQTQQMPQGIQSPVPQSSIVPHDRGPVGSWDNSWLGIGANALGNSLSNMMPKPAISGPMQRMPMPTAIPTRPPVQSVLGMQTQQPTMAPTTMPTAMPTMAPTITPTPQQQLQQQQLTSDFEKQTLPVFQQHGISPAVAYGIAAAEGGRIGQHNIWNINATDSNPQGATNYSSIQQGALGAARLIQRMLQSQGVTSNDPNVQLLAIERAGYAGDPNTWQQRSAATGGAGKNGVRYWHQLVQSTPQWKNWMAQH